MSAADTYMRSAQHLNADVLHTRFRGGSRGYSAAPKHVPCKLTDCVVVPALRAAQLLCSLCTSPQLQRRVTLPLLGLDLDNLQQGQANHEQVSRCLPGQSADQEPGADSTIDGMRRSEKRSAHQRRHAGKDSA